MKLNQLYEVKPVCLIASDNVCVDGDVILHKGDLGEVVGGFTHAFSVDNKKNIVIQNCVLATKFPKELPFKIKLLWLWHMVILRKSHVYLTGVVK